MPTSVTPVSRRLVVVLVALFTALSIALAFEPFDRADWAIENVLVVALAVFLVRGRHWIRLSTTATLMLFVFCCTHAIGAHYTYAEVPYDDWARALTGHTVNEVLGLERNHFDRYQHFSYGFLLATPVRELLLRKYDLPKFLSYAVLVELTLSTSAVYELVEWLAAIVLGGELGAAYLGTQGDPWDAHADMALATLGAASVMFATYVVERRRPSPT